MNFQYAKHLLISLAFPLIFAVRNSLYASLFKKQIICGSLDKDNVLYLQSIEKLFNHYYNSTNSF